MLGEFPGNSWHVRRTPGEDFPALTEEFDKRAFLCGVEIIGDHRRLGGIRRVDLHLLCVDGGVERHIRCVLPCDWGCPIVRHLAEPTSSSCMPNDWEILLKSLSQWSDRVKLPWTVMTPLGPGILSSRYA